MDVSRKRSAVWTQFDMLSGTTAKCKICKKTYSYKGGSTGNLKRHIKDVHVTVRLEEARQEDEGDTSSSSTATASARSSGGPTATPASSSATPASSSATPASSTSTTAAAVATAGSATGTNPRPRVRGAQSSLTHFVTRPMDPLRQKRVDDLLARMVARDLQPYTVVEDIGFRDFVKELNPNYVLPSRKTLSTRIVPDLFNRTYEIVQNSVDKAESVCLTTDCWTSRTTDSYMSVTCHFVNEDFEMVSFLLDCFALEERHTDENLAKELLRVAVEWNIEDKVAACVTDGAANIIKAMGPKQAGGTGWPHAICFAHQLNLIVHNGIKNFKNTVDKVKAIVQYFHKSNTATAELKKQQINSGRAELRRKQECPTRWNSTFFMLRRMLETREPVIITMALLNVELPTPSPEEWEDMQTVCDILEPFDEVTVELSSERYVFLKHYCIVML